MTDIKRKIDALPPAKKDATGKVSFTYLKKIYYIAKHAALTQRYEPLKQNYLRKRRDIL